MPAVPRKYQRVLYRRAKLLTAAFANCQQRRRASPDYDSKRYPHISIPPAHRAGFKGVAGGPAKVRSAGDEGARKHAISGPRESASVPAKRVTRYFKE